MTDSARQLEGRHAVVTGGGRGIGAAVALELARAGANVTLTGRDARALEKQAAAVREAHSVEVTAIQCDVSDASAVSKTFREMRKRFPAPHILVNNAGQADGGAFLDTTPEVWDRLFAVNLRGPVQCIREVLPGMLEAKSGRIVNISSMAGLKGYARTTAYTASKHAIIGLTRSLALEVRKKGITVNAVCPGYTETGMSDLARRSIMTGLGRSAEEAHALLIRDIPRGSIIRPEEVARVVAWLCTPAAASINGQAIPVAGGEI